MGFFDFLKKKDIQSNINIKTTLKDESNKNINLSKEELEHQIAFKKCMLNSTASSRGLFPHEILMLTYAHSFAQSGNSFQGFWYYQYHVKNPQEILNSLEERGFIKPGSLEATLEHEPVVTLKSELKSMGLKQTGKKADLVLRLVTEGDITDLNNRYNNRRFQLTEIGKSELKDNEYIAYIHKKSRYDLDMWTLNQLMNEPPDMSYRDKIWGFFNKQSLKHYKARDFGLYRNVRFNMCDFLLEEKKYSEGLLFISETIYYDLSGVENGFTENDESNMFDIELEMYFPYEESCATIPPGILRTLEVIIEALELTEEQLRDKLYTNFKKFHLPRHLFTIEECTEIVLAELHGDKENLKKIYDVAEKRFRRNTPFKV